MYMYVNIEIFCTSRHHTHFTSACMYVVHYTLFDHGCVSMFEGRMHEMYLVVHPVPGELMMTAKEVAYMIYIWRKLDCVQCYMLHYWMWYTTMVGSSLKQPHPKYVDCEVGGVVCGSIAVIKHN